MARLVVVGVAALAVAWVGCSGKSTTSNGDGGTGGAAATTATGTSTGTGPAPVSATSGPTSVTVASSTTGGGMITVECNPITNEPCDTAGGEACDVAFADGAFQGFQCYGPPNDKPLCGDCNGSDGPFCAGTMTCADKKCARFCCTDADCGTGKCAKDDGMGGEFFPGVAAVGLCFGAMQAPACDAAPVAASNGSCVMVGGSTSASSSTASGSGGAGGGA